jgi:protein-S-isoprenylcysteine O-methyltransferase Ste14
MLDFFIIKILIGIDFFFFVFNVAYVICNKQRGNQDIAREDVKSNSLNAKRILAIIGILSLNLFLIICCINIFIYEFIVVSIIRLDFFNEFLYLRILGFLITLFGDIILFISYKTLGNNWAYPIDNWRIKRKLVTSGIYSKIRHPIYLSFNIISIGFILLIQDWFLLILYLFGAIGLYIQTILEEITLVQHFGEEYLKYQEKTGRFFCFCKKMEKN